ncbi:hypothetical protein OC834_005839 [Tilletia horrida]|uniref:Uncharacterized protein n=1 Tax=Tilletia horrida TaxID=155126 RepID=A0AAN6G373_9BASI|nr:hypothetical protein OC842_007721 [Tilletia horrida]KAK0523602.1 hypothetical protein OC834_005839 [Tilletia horrida]KAK0525318.1 hypothetical protein OC835_005647 [Tilletia horrida]
MQLQLASLALALASVSLTAAVQTCVNSNNGLVGECIATSSCSSQGGSSAAGFCPGAADIQAGLCPGGTEIQCCQNAPGVISGLNAIQSAHAYQIARAVRDKGLNRQACLIAITTGITEANLLNYANSDVSASFNYQYDAVSSDYDSVGVFQQRVSYYPNIDADMDPYQSAGAFLDKMVNVDGWQTADVGSVCQDVQGSAYPDRYNENVSQASGICSAMGF